MLSCDTSHTIWYGREVVVFSLSVRFYSLTTYLRWWSFLSARFWPWICFKNLVFSQRGEGFTVGDLSEILHSDASVSVLVRRVCPYLLSPPSLAPLVARECISGARGAADGVSSSIFLLLTMTLFVVSVRWGIGSKCVFLKIFLGIFLSGFWSVKIGHFFTI